MSLAPYRSVLARPRVREILILGFVIRVPIWAAGVLMTLHVVSTLGRSYSEAGFVVLLSTLALTIANPWRGRLLDRYGLRRVVAPSILVLAVCWSIAPFVGYWPMAAFVVLAGLFSVPTFSIIRQAMIAEVSADERRTALSLDSVATEISYMVGPALGVWIGTTLPTSWGLCLFELLGVAAAIVLWVVDPALRSDDAEEAGERAPFRAWFTPGVFAVLVVAGTTTIVLTGTDLGLVALLRESGQTPLLGLVLAFWGLGSAIGGLVYGGLGRSIPGWVLLLLLGAVTVPVGVSTSVPVVSVLATVAGLLCAPTITATVEQLSELVSAANRGEALGWHGSFMTAGSALGAPLTGFVLDRDGATEAFAVVGAVGVAVALAGGAALHVRRRRRAYGAASAT